MYGIPYPTDRIVKYDPINDIASLVGEEAEHSFFCTGDGGLGTDGCIYAARRDGRVMKINTNNGSHCVVGHSVDPGQYSNSDIILGIDGCIYWPPVKSRRIRKYDPQLIKLRSSETTLQAYNGNGMEDIWHSMGSSIVCRTMKIGFFLLIQRRNMYRP